MRTKLSKSRVKPVSISLAVLANLVFGVPAAFSDETAAVNPPAAQSTAAPAAETSATTPAQPVQATTAGAPLQGGVKLVEPSLEHLRDLGIDLKHVMTGASHLYDEVNIAPVSLETVPEVVGRGIIINIPIGTQQMGPPAPPRKDRLDVAMAQITPVVTQLKSDVDKFMSGQQRLDITDQTRTELRPVFESWASSVTAMATQVTNLQSLVAGPKFDNGAISAAAQQIQSNCQVLQKDLKKVYKSIQKEGKRSRKA